MPTRITDADAATVTIFQLLNRSALAGRPSIPHHVSAFGFFAVQDELLPPRHNGAGSGECSALLLPRELKIPVSLAGYWHSSSKQSPPLSVRSIPGPLLSRTNIRKQ